MKITEEQQEILQTFQHDRDQSALALGVTLLEFETRKAYFLNAIEQSKKRQRKRGDAFLKALGLDIEKNDYKIDSNRIILILIAGEWKVVD